MGVTVLTVLAALVLKAIAVKAYDDCKIGIWVVIIVNYIIWIRILIFIIS